jgi:murein DD-endopeptidase MepM/ murein hydrolase activator NlpD
VVAARAAAIAALLALAACGGSSADEGATQTPIARAGPVVTPLKEVATPTPTATPFRGTFEYVVAEGDTLSQISERFNVPLSEVVAANGLTDASGIVVGQVLVIPNGEYGPTPTALPTARPENPVGPGFIIPIAGACLPDLPNLMPNAPREYRAGVHEGVDFFHGFSCVDIDVGTPVLAVAAGRVIRADHQFTEMTQEELNEILNRSLRQGYTDAAALDRFRGRQVWLEHGEGIVTRYAHLSAIPEEITPGMWVEQGTVIGFVGDSGTPEAVENPGVENHLHFEIRVGDTYLGAGLPYDQMRALYEEVFSQP